MCAVVRPRLLCVQWVSRLSDIPRKATCERKERMKSSLSSFPPVSSGISPVLEKAGRVRGTKGKGAKD